MKYYFSLLLLCTFMNFGCSEFSAEQQELLDKKWYSGNGDYVEFKSDMTLVIKIEPYDSFQHKFEFKSNHSVNLISSKEDSSKELASFYVKDSVLLLISHKNAKEDSTFYHLNEKYEKWQSKQIFIYGKVMTEQEPLPYFEF